MTHFIHEKCKSQILNTKAGFSNIMLKDIYSQTDSNRIVAIRTLVLYVDLHNFTD